MKSLFASPTIFRTGDRGQESDPGRRPSNGENHSRQDDEKAGTARDGIWRIVRLSD